MPIPSRFKSLKDSLKNAGWTLEFLLLIRYWEEEQKNGWPYHVETLTPLNISFTDFVSVGSPCWKNKRKQREISLNGQGLTLLKRRVLKTNVRPSSSVWGTNKQRLLNQSIKTRRKTSSGLTGLCAHPSSHPKCKAMALLTLCRFIILWYRTTDKILTCLTFWRSLGRLPQLWQLLGGRVVVHC